MSGKNLKFFAVALGLATFLSSDYLVGATITGVTIEDFSSQLTGPFTRFANNTVNGSGLTGLQHSIVPDGTMWLSTGSGAAGGTPDPNQPGAQITFNLGNKYALSSMRVWNYNEVGPYNSRSARQVQLLAASSVGGPFTNVGTITLTQAPGANTYTGEVIDFVALNLNLADVRLLRFNILNSYGGDTGFVGLSEVQFNGSLVPEPSAQVAWIVVGSAFTAFVVYRRRWSRAVR